MWIAMFIQDWPWFSLFLAALIGVLAMILRGWWNDFRWKS